MDAQPAMSEAAANRIIKLSSSDGTVLTISRKAIRHAETANRSIENANADAAADSENPPIEGSIPMSNVDTWTLQKIITWCEHHANDPIPTVHPIEPRNITISPWDAEFLNVDHEALYKIIMAANYMEVTGLLEIACKTIANMMEGLTTVQLRSEFGITHDFTDAELAQIERENAWCDGDDY